MKKYAFLDRDGTLIFEPRDTFKIDGLEKLRILDGVIDGLKKLKKLGYSLVMVTNQNGIGRPEFPWESFEIPQKKMMDIFAENEIYFEKVFVCPHLPEENCNCRKPKTGLVEDFFKSADVDLGNSFMCGDRDTDVEFGRNLGIKAVKIETNSTFDIELILKTLNS